LLPCWWGITPGKTTLIEAKQHLASKGFQLGSPFNTKDMNEYAIYGGLEVLDGRLILFNKLIEQNNVIELVTLQVFEFDGDIKEMQTAFENYSPQRILATYGKPSRVWLVTSASNFYGDRTFYELWFFYDSDGILIKYSQPMDFADIYHICPRFEDGKGIEAIDIILGSPVNVTSLEKLTFIQNNNPSPEYVYPIEDLNYSIDTFYSIVFNGVNKGCLNVSSEALVK
jgi:hypothetical protein